MNILPKNNPLEFEQFLLEQVNLDLFNYKFLNLYFSSLRNGDDVLYDNSVLNIQENGWILILHGKQLLVYGENWSEKQFQEIASDIDFNKFTNYIVSGDSKLIHSLISFNKLTNYLIEKERIFYRARHIENLPLNKDSISKGILKDLYELAKMLQEYYAEEYSGQNNKTIEEMIRKVQELIASEEIYVLKDSTGEISSFCTLTNPDIGIIYTKTQYRRLGKGKKLLSYCSNLLLKENWEIYLMTDKNVISSNKTCSKVGFIPFFEYTSIRINNG